MNLNLEHKKCVPIQSKERADLAYIDQIMSSQDPMKVITKPDRLEAASIFA